jgi:uncharacterized protein DUF5313
MTSVERQVHWLVRAWPYPDRIERAEEIVSTTLDLVPEGHGWLPFAVAWNLLIGGLTARWRARPPLWRWLYYEMGGRLPMRWHRWMINDLMGPGWRFRAVRVRTTMMLTATWLGVLTSQAIFHAPAHHSALSNPFLIPLYWLVLGAGIVLVSTWQAKRFRDRTLARHGYLTPPYYNVPPARSSTPT